MPQTDGKARLVSMFAEDPGHDCVSGIERSNRDVMHDDFDAPLPEDLMREMVMLFWKE
jgi:hypothetical protein